jgi:hypothetical protein
LGCRQTTQTSLEGFEPLLYIVKWGLPIFCTKLFHFLKPFSELPALSPLSQPVSSSRRIKAFRPITSDSNQFHWPFSTGLDPALIRAPKSYGAKELLMVKQTYVKHQNSACLPTLLSFFRKVRAKRDDLTNDDSKFCLYFFPQTPVDEKVA